MDGAETLDDLVASLPDVVDRVAEVDVTRWFPPAKDAEGNAVRRLWRYAEPTAQRIYQALELTPRVRVRDPELPQMLAATIAQLAVCHLSPLPKVAPGKKAPDMVGLYLQLAKRSAGLLFAIQAAWREAFPEMQDLEGAARAEKNASSAAPRA